MSRETIDAKAKRLLAEGRLTVDARNGDLIVAHCAGDTGTYRLGFDPGRGEWWCDCPARRRCAHLSALALATVDRTLVEAAA